MYYLKSLFFNFFIVFFANHILPGIDVANQTKLPHLGGDIIFAVALGFLNSLIFPVLKIVHQSSIGKIGALALVINLVAYACLKLLPIGIHITSFTGYCTAAILVAIGSLFTNLFEMKHSGKVAASAPAAAADNPFLPK